MAGKKKRREPTQVPDTRSKSEILPDDRHAHTVETPYGRIVYTYSPKILSGILGGIFTTLLGRAYYNRPLNFHKLLEKPEEEPPYEYLFTREPELLAENEQHTEYAAELLHNQVPRLLVEASEQLIQEVVFRTISELQGQSRYKLSHGISELLKQLTAEIIERVKGRVNAPTQGGSKAKWTPERKEAFLITYENACEVLKDAKRIYRQNKGLKTWRGMISVAYPELPEHLINLLPEKGKVSEPGILAYEYAAKLFNVKYTDYLSDVVKDARRWRREKSGIKNEI